MSVQVIGNYPTIARQKSGLFSLDLAMSSRGELGVPMRTVIELYGYTNAGKSTLAYYLTGVLTGKGNVGVCDLENADRDYIKICMEHAGMDGDVHLIDSVDEKGAPIPHEYMLGDLAVKFSEDNFGAAILDSVGAIQPMAEAEGDFGEAFMGKRAKLVAQVSRNFANAVRNKSKPSVAVVINHVHSIIGGRGHQTAGGETLKYLAAARIMIWPNETFTATKDEQKPVGFYVSGRLEKFRYGGKGRTFGYYIVPQYGVHTGASAMFDCFELGLAERSTTVKMDGKSFGYLNKDLLAYAYEGKQRKFEPFKEKLIEYEAELLRSPNDFGNEVTDSDGEIARKNAKTSK